MYHVMSRGNRRADIYLDDVDRQDFLKTLAEACLKTGWQVHAYCLMSNHYHLVLETPNANLVAGMAWLQSTYTIRLNHRHKLIGHVLSGRYKAHLVEGSGTGYLRTACDYVHLNPVRAAVLKSEERLLSYPWSSFGYYLAAPRHRPGWMRVDRLLGEHGLQEDSAETRQEFERRMERRACSPGMRRGSERCAGVGVWAARSSRNRSSKKSTAKWVNTTSARCGWRRRRSEPNGLSSRNCAVWAGRKLTWRRGASTIRARSTLLCACAGRRRFRLSRSPGACTLAPPRARAFVCSQSCEPKPQPTRRRAGSTYERNREK